MGQTALILLPAVGDFPWRPTGVTLPGNYVTVPAKESAMLSWLLRLWRGLSAWMMPRPDESTHHHPVLRPYQPSNLHARHH